MKIFDMVEFNSPKRNSFDLSHEKKLSLNMGDLVPILCQEILPGDSFKVNTELMMRMAPLMAPVMHRVNVYTHYFFVSNRIIFNKWEQFITGGDDGRDNTPMPTIQITNFNQPKNGTLWDYFGLPQVTEPDPGPVVNSLPFRAYAEIWNEYYRDENLQEKIDYSKGVTQTNQQIENLLTLRKRSWEKDYFTSALPFVQKGEPVRLPIQGTAQINQAPTSPTITQPSQVTGTYDPGNTPNVNGQAEGQAYMPGSLLVDLENATSTTINDLRKAYALQRWLEKAARGGSRLTEHIKIMFGITSSDARLQRPEYLGGGKSPIVISEVLQTADTQEGQVGHMAGHGISVGATHSFSRTFEEHGYIIGIMSVLPRTAYMQGVPRHFLKQNKFDFFQPDFAHLGEQEVYDNELYYQGATHKGVFGYQPRYTEYRFNLDSVHGDFKDTLLFWHMGRHFAAAPQLNEDFIKASDITRIYAVEGEPDAPIHHLYCQLFHNIKAIRPLPLFANPI